MNPIAIPDRAHRDDQELERGPKSTGIRKQQMRTEYSGNGQERKSYRDSKKFTTTSHDVTHRLDSPQFAHAPGLHARTCNANQRRREPLGAAGWEPGTTPSSTSARLHLHVGASTGAQVQRYPNDRLQPAYQTAK